MPVKKETTWRKKLARRYEWLPWLFVLIALPVCYFIWYAEQVAELQAGKKTFDWRLSLASQRLTNQLALYEQALYGMRSLFDSSEFVSEEEFKLFVAEMLRANFATGLIQVGFIKFENQPGHHAPVIYTVSKIPKPNAKITFDAYQNEVLRKALISSAENNQALLSQAVSANQEGKNYSILLPVYAKSNSQASFTQGGIRLPVYGWVYVNLDMRAVFNETLSGQPLPNTKLRYRVYNPEGAGSALLYENVADTGYKSHYYGEQALYINGKRWVLFAQSLRPFEEKVGIGLISGHTKVGLIALFVTAALSSILFLIVGRLRTYDALRQANEQLKLSDERWRFALEGSGDGIWDWDIPGDKVTYSKRWKQIFGFGEAELDGTVGEWENLLHPDDRQLAIDTLNAYLQGDADSYSLEYRLQCKDRSWKWILSRGMVVTRDERGKPIRMVGTHTDISQLKESEEQIWQHANFDYLTNLPNRRMLYARLEREIAKCKRTNSHLALLFLDLDGFKEINDTLGHDEGDGLLRQAAKRLTDCTYAQDVVARLGGDEFIVLISEIDATELKHLEFIAQKVLAALAAPFELSHQKAFVTASLGIAIYPEDSTTIDGLLKNVDQAMYASKSRGGNCFTYFTPEMQESALARLHISNDLRLALEREELFVEYQPIVALQSGNIYKAEALLRWQHPEKGLISPDVFIPIAEDTRQINEIGNWVFKQAIHQCKNWRKTIDQGFQIAVNKSPVQFMNTDAQHSEWIHLLSNDAVEDREVSIEITESLLLEPTGQVGSKLQDYRTRGIQIALDDFGTGYSSLSYLRKFEIDYLKIDRSFVANLAHSAEDRVLCRAIIVMAHSLGIKVVAEGIETKEQCAILLEAECDLGQGYYFAKSLLPDAFEAYVQRHQASE